MEEGICVGAMVVVHCLQKDTQHNGALAEVTKFILSEPENKCEVKIVEDTNQEETHIRLRLSRLALVQGAQPHRGPPAHILPLSPPPLPLNEAASSALALRQPFTQQPISRMVWSSVESRRLLERKFIQEAALYDPEGITRACHSLWVWLIYKLGVAIRDKKPIGKVAWEFVPHVVGDIRYGFVWSFGNTEQEQPLPPGLSKERMREYGCQWWPVIWIYVDGMLPVYCPGLAWQGARPWRAHRTRIYEIDRPDSVPEQMDLGWEIVHVADVVEERDRVGV